MTESVRESMVGDPPSADLEKWRQEEFRLVYRRRKTLMLDDGGLDIIDLLLIAPEIANGLEHREESDDYERRRRRRLEKYQPDWNRIAEEWQILRPASPAEPGRTCTTCHHEPAWAKCLSTDTWLHGLCARTGFGLNKRRRCCYSWDARIVDCPKWAAKTATGKQRCSSQRNAANEAVSRPVAANGRRKLVFEF